MRSHPLKIILGFGMPAIAQRTEHFIDYTRPLSRQHHLGCQCLLAFDHNRADHLNRRCRADIARNDTQLRKAKRRQHIYAIMRMLPGDQQGHR